MSATKFKKGDVVWIFYRWNVAAAAARKVTLMSMGKVRGTALEMKDGKMVKTFIQPDDEMVLVSEMADPSAKLMEMAVAFKAAQIKHYQHRAQQFIDADIGYHKAMKADCERVMATEPSIHIR